MIFGRYGNTSGRPYVDAYVFVQSLGAEGIVSFLIDTGADTSVLMPVDALRLGIDYSKLSTSTQSFGIGGNSTDFLEPSVIVVADGSTHGYHIPLTIMKNRPVLRRAPSLLGRDVINNWQIDFDPSNSNLLIEIISSDFVL